MALSEQQRRWIDEIASGEKMTGETSEEALRAALQPHTSRDGTFIRASTKDVIEAVLALLPAMTEADCAAHIRDWFVLQNIRANPATLARWLYAGEFLPAHALLPRGEATKRFVIGTRTETRVEQVDDLRDSKIWRDLHAHPAAPSGETVEGLPWVTDIAVELDLCLDRFLNSIGGEPRSRAKTRLANFLWDNKVGILRALQARALSPAPTAGGEEDAQEIERLLASIDAATASLKSPPSPAPEGWRCFHCDVLFTTREAAKEHFGHYTFAPPVCIP